MPIFPSQKTQTFPVRTVFINGLPAMVNFVITDEMQPDALEVTTANGWFAPPLSFSCQQGVLRITLARPHRRGSIKVKNTGSNQVSGGGTAISGVSIGWPRASSNVIFKTIDAEGQYNIADIGGARVAFTIRAAPGVSYEYHP